MDSPHPSFRPSSPSVAWLLGAAGLPAHVDPGTAALKWADTTRSYESLRRRALGLAASMRAQGLRDGDRVATYLYNRGEIFELYFACAFGGFTLVPINFRFSSEETAEILRDCDVKWLVSETSLADTARAAASAASIGPVTLLEAGAGGDEYEHMCAADPRPRAYPLVDPHLILLSSGTTGRPKGAMLSHHAILWYAMQQAALYPGYASDMVLLVTGPLYNTGGINDLTIATFLVGGTVTILPSREWSPSRMGEHIDRWGVTHAVVFPSMMEPMLEADAREPLPLASLRLVVTGGENCPVPTVERFRRRWSHASLAIGYGSTELGLASMIWDRDIEAHPGSVGRAVAGSAIRVVDPNGRELDPPAIGEILVAGGGAFSGYHNAPELNAATCRDGWIATGDLGHWDEDGYLYVDGRSKDMIISGGQNIYPAEIENVLAGFEHLLEATVVGVPDPRWGEAVCAVVVAKPGEPVTEQDVVDFVTTHLASYKKPKHVVFVDRLPRNASQKVLKTILRQRLQSGELRLHAARSTDGPDPE
jgi:fatty-acyl-CoA synthase